jgi:hypothetical protein
MPCSVRPMRERHRPMDLDWLKDFLVLAERRNFSRAADARNVTQPAFSRRIRALEDWIGTPLFVRGAQGATLTPSGVHFRPIAEEMMGVLHRGRRETKAIGEREASLSIAATHALSFTFFPLLDSKAPAFSGAWHSQSDLGQHGRLRRNHARRGGGFPALPPSRRCADAFRGRSVSEHFGWLGHLGRGLRPGCRGPWPLAARYHLRKDVAAARL